MKIIKFGSRQLILRQFNWMIVIFAFFGSFVLKASTVNFLEEDCPVAKATMTDEELSGIWSCLETQANYLKIIWDKLKASGKLSSVMEAEYSTMRENLRKHWPIYMGYYNQYINVTGGPTKEALNNWHKKWVEWCNLTIDSNKEVMRIIEANNL